MFYYSDGDDFRKVLFDIWYMGYGVDYSSNGSGGLDMELE